MQQGGPKKPRLDKGKEACLEIAPSSHVKLTRGDGPLYNHPVWNGSLVSSFHFKQIPTGRSPVDSSAKSWLFFVYLRKETFIDVCSKTEEDIVFNGGDVNNKESLELQIYVYVEEAVDDHCPACQKCFCTLITTCLSHNLHKAPPKSTLRPSGTVSIVSLQDASPPEGARCPRFSRPLCRRLNPPNPFSSGYISLSCSTKLLLAPKSGGEYSTITGYWQKLPDLNHFDFYLFNITNPDEIEYLGAKPSVLEYGPYSFRRPSTNTISTGRMTTKKCTLETTKCSSLIRREHARHVPTTTCLCCQMWFICKFIGLLVKFFLFMVLLAFMYILYKIKENDPDVSVRHEIFVSSRLDASCLIERTSQ
ncbi:hypothetical protein L596_013542 [Steinernema carpocapsae]|uniref:Uncharacterized protein n=1 Tax=Steinernema carpocapsae TaxID=34508 RepID=A0A4U5P151_STECR|nr:hypothetical protein L596_013542 [Steinernema carpocapsae]